MALSDEERVRLQAKRKGDIELRATGLYLYHPTSGRWIPAQCDEDGRLVIDPSDLDLRYVKLDGSNDMTGDWIGLKNTYPIAHATYVCGSTSYAWDGVTAISLSAYYTLRFYGDGTILARENVAGYIRFSSYDGSAFKTCAEIVGGKFAIQRAADITAMPDSVLDWSDGLVNEHTIADGHDILCEENQTNNLGTAAKNFCTAYLHQIQLDGEVVFDPGDNIQYDRTNNRFLFYIGGSVVGYVDTDGWHNGAP